MQTTSPRSAPRRPCRKPGCNALHTNPTGLCDKHDAEDRKRVDLRRGTPASRGYDAAWRALRAIKLRANPMCEAKGCKRVASLVHHIDKNPRNNSQDNLMSLCNACHEAVHIQDRFAPRTPGGGEAA